jgi:hypothetical protein
MRVIFEDIFYLSKKEQQEKRERGGTMHASW